MKMQHASRIALWLLLSAVQVMADSDSDSNDSSDGDGSGSGSGGEAPAAKGGMSGGKKFGIALVVVVVIGAVVGLLGHFLGWFGGGGGGAAAGGVKLSTFKLATPEVHLTICEPANWELEAAGDTSDVFDNDKCMKACEALGPKACLAYAKQSKYGPTTGSDAASDKTPTEKCILQKHTCALKGGVTQFKNYEGLTLEGVKSTVYSTADVGTTLVGMCQEDFSAPANAATLAACGKTAADKRFVTYVMEKKESACGKFAEGCCKQHTTSMCTVNTLIQTHEKQEGTCTEWATFWGTGENKKLDDAGCSKEGFKSSGGVVHNAQAKDAEADAKLTTKVPRAEYSDQCCYKPTA